MTADGRIDMSDIAGMLCDGDLDLTPPKSVGRIVTGFNGLILGLESKSSRLLEDNMVYDIESKNGILTLKRKGKSRIDFKTENRDISQILLMESTKLILTQMEEYNMELNEELADKGWFETRDRYLVEADEKVKGVEDKFKMLCNMYPMSKYPDKWV